MPSLIVGMFLVAPWFIGGLGLVFDLGTSSLWLTFSAGIGFAMSYWIIGKRVRAFAADLAVFEFVNRLYIVLQMIIMKL